MCTSQPSSPRKQSVSHSALQNSSSLPEPDRKEKEEVRSPPAMKSPPPLPTSLIQSVELDKITQDDNVASSPRSSKKIALGFSFPIFRSPRKRALEKDPNQSDDQIADSGSLSAPVTPRSASAAPDSPSASSGRRRVDSSPQKLPTSTPRQSAISIPILPSTQNADIELYALGAEVARLIFSEMKSAKPLLTKEAIDSLARFEIQIPIEKMSPALHMKLAPATGKTQSHAQLIKRLFMPRLLDTQVGKTLVAMRNIVMLQYNGEKMTVADRIKIEETNLHFKQLMQANIEEQAKACADIALGTAGSVKTPSLATSKLPPSLLAFWAAMDRELCAWAAGNPALDELLLTKARENLGFDILATRLILPIASGDKDDAHLVIPMMFFNAVKNALKAEWSDFFSSFMATAKNGTVTDGNFNRKISDDETSGSLPATPTSTLTTVMSNTVTSTTTTTTTTSAQHDRQDSLMG